MGFLWRAHCTLLTCVALRFRIPQEGLTLDQNAAELLSESVGNDVRQVLNCLQMWSQRTTKVGYMDVKNRMKQVEKDSILRMTPFDGVRTILDPGTKSLNER